MGGNQPKGQKPTAAQVEDSSFFKKQMIIHSQVLNIEKKYTLEQQIGQGTYATVFRGRSVRAECPRCIKRVDKSKAPGIQQTLLNEFSILRGLDHPNVMNIYGLYEDQKYFYVIAQLIKGQQLFCEFKQKKKFCQSQTFQIFRQVLLCLHNLHKNKIMHRDIKLENMIYNPKTRLVKLIDFGTAVEFSSEARAPYKLVGTASYIAPEVIAKNYNHMCDVWSLGVLLHLLLTGNLPFVGKNQEEIFQVITSAPPNLNSPVYEKLPQAKALVTRMLQKSPEKRITIPQIIKHPWYENLHLKQSLPPVDHECMLNLFANMRKFSTLKIADIQLGILVFIVNFIVQYENEDSIVRCFHWINLEGDGVITEEELAKAFVEYEDRPEKKAKQEAAEIMSKIDFNQSKDIDYSEFLVASTSLKKIINDDTLQRAFRMIDSDLSGNISFQQLKDHLGDHVSEIHFKKIMSFCDLNKTGEISLKEFKDMMKKVLV